MEVYAFDILWKCLLVKNMSFTNARYTAMACKRYLPRVLLRFVRATIYPDMFSSYFILLIYQFYNENSDFLFIFRAQLFYVVRVGDYYNRDDMDKAFRNLENSVDFNIEKIFKSPGYNTVPGTKNDLTLIRLEDDNNDNKCAVYG